MELMKERIDLLRNNLKSAAEAGGYPVPAIIAVSKTVEPERINPVFSLGLTHLGENRVQEIVRKLPELDARFKIDLIGQLQINKVNRIIDKVACIQSLDRMELAQEIDRRAQQHGLRMPVLIEVNIGGEAQKSGIDPEMTLTFARYAASLPGLQVRGLMTVLPDFEDKEDCRPLMRRMRSLFEQLQAEAIQGTLIDQLSMGMSGDYMQAAREGSTHVRIGSAIFGARAAVQQ